MYDNMLPTTAYIRVLRNGLSPSFQQELDEQEKCIEQLRNILLAGK